MASQLWVAWARHGFVWFTEAKTAAMLGERVNWMLLRHQEPWWRWFQWP